MTDPTQPTLSSLAAKITELSDTFTQYLRQNNVAEPNFAADSPTRYSNLSPEMFMTRQLLLDTLMDMWYLTSGPSESIFNYAHCCMPDAACLNVLNSFNFWSAVPLEGSSSYSEIAERVSLPLEVAQRILQHAVTLRMFSETEPGKSSSRIQHTSRSAAVAKSAGLKALVSTIMDDAGPPMMVLNEALQRYSYGKPSLPQVMSETAFALFHKGGQFGGHANSWDLLENDGEGEKKGWRQRNFVTFMKYIKDIFGLEKVALDFLDWKSLGKATVVDIGGSAGHDSMMLAKHFPDLTMVVQDLLNCKTEFNASLPPELKDRVSFMEYTMFDLQPVQADVYLFKMILHDWPDEEAKAIIRNLIPALKPGAKVIIYEYIGTRSDEEMDKGPQLPRSMRQYGTATDLRMMALWNARERPVEAWKQLLQTVDSRFDVSDVRSNPNQPFYATIEAVWRGLCGLSGCPGLDESLVASC